VKWFREVYTHETQDKRVRLSERDKPSIVAHSFGTYILGNAMLKYDWLRFDKVILCGSILPMDFPWDKLIERGQVQAVRNEYGVQDVWVKLVSWFVAGTGPSGHKGFSVAHDRLLQEEFDYEHSEYFDSGHMQAKWLPFLNERYREILPSTLTAPRVRLTRPLGLYAIYVIVICAFAATIYSAMS
jgi:serine/threonine-protein kinase